MEREPEILWFILEHPHKPEEALVPVEVIGGLDAVLPIVETPSVNVGRITGDSRAQKGHSSNFTIAASQAYPERKRKLWKQVHGCLGERKARSALGP